MSHSLQPEDFTLLREVHYGGPHSEPTPDELENSRLIDPAEWHSMREETTGDSNLES